MATHTIPEDWSSERFDKALAKLETSLSRSRIKALILSGCADVDGETRFDPSSKVRGGEEVEIRVPGAEPATPQPEDIALDVLFEDSDVIVLNKPAGMVVHPAPGHTTGTLVNALLHHCGDSLTGIGGVSRPGIVHRLDKDTSGLMVAAKTDHAQQHLVGQFSERTISRTYVALAAGVPSPSSGTIDAPIGRSRHNRKKMAILETAGREAITDYETIAAFGLWCSEVRCALRTGRTHQIRVHLAHTGHPVIGDPLYGRVTRHISKAPSDLKNACAAFSRQALHAKALSFRHPTTEAMVSFKAPPPKDYQDLRALLDRQSVRA